jgi:hypothetical protein
MKPRGKMRARRAIDIALILLFLAAILATANEAHKLWQHLSSAQNAMLRLETALAGGQASLRSLLQNPDQLAAVESDLAMLETSLAGLEDLSQPFLPLLPHLSWLPVIGGDAANAPNLLYLAQQTTAASHALVSGLAPLAEQLNEQGTGIGQLGPELVGGLVGAQPQIDTAQAALARAAEARAAIDAAQLSSRTGAMLDRLDRFRPLLESGANLLAILPGLLGAEEPRTYLLLAQNNHELRATGGFISGVGLVRLDRGQVADLHFQDSYTVDDLNQPHPPPPEPLRRYMGAGMLLLRDANWWPDFPTSAREIVALYQQDQHQTIEGIIAVDLSSLQLLLQATGPIQVQGYDRPVTSGNLQAMIMTYWEGPQLTAPGKEGTDWWLHRKDFAADLLSALVNHLQQNADLDVLFAMAQAMGKALQERHVLVYVDEDQAQTFFREMNWDGALRASSGDYLMIVDSNVGFNKVNPNIEQTIDYMVTLEESGVATAQLALSYRHRIQYPTPACVHEPRYGDSYADLMERCYWDYVRIYLPQGSELVEVEGADGSAKVYQESGHTVVGSFFLLETGEARQIAVVYHPKLASPQQGYALLVQKQPGTGSLPLRVSVIPPDGVQPTQANPSGGAWVDDHFVWQGVLDQDQEIEFSWE